MSVLSQPNHPARLAWLFASTIAAAGIVAAAAVAVIYMVQDQRGARSSSVAGASIVPGNIEAPEGLIVVIPMENAKQFEEFTGFKPFIPERVPGTTDGTAKLAVTQPDEHGNRVGRVAFSAKRDAAVNGITGPIVVLAEAKGKPGDGVDGQLKRITSGDARAIVTTMQCGDLVIDVQLYFGPQAEQGERIITPYMIDVAQQFVDGVKEQCGE